MKVYILRGAPGSGKSTWAAAMQAKHGLECSVYSTDSFFLDGDGVYKFDPKLLGKYHAANLAAYTRALLRNHPGVEILIVDNTNVSVVEIAPYYRVAEAFGADVTICSFYGQFTNAHGVPQEKVLAMRARMLEEEERYPQYLPRTGAKGMWNHIQVQAPE